MSRIGDKPIALPEGVSASLNGRSLEVKGPKGTLTLEMHEDMALDLDEQSITINRPSDAKPHRMLHGTYRAHIANLVEGVSKGYSKKLKMVGVGYRAQKQGNKLTINAGYSQPVELDIPEGIEVAVDKNTLITVSGIDKQRVGEFAANVRAVRKPEPYLGKGIRYVDEHVRRKEGKTAT